MMFEKWVTSGWNELPMVVLSCAGTYVAILAYTRLVGLRSFSKMSAADFAMTVAVGSLFASTTALSTPSLVIGLGALGSLFGGQWALAYLRSRVSGFSRLIDNQPLLLMHDGRILEENLKKAKVTKDDLFSKLREANALTYDDVLAVVFETTGDISVLHSSDPDAVLERDFVADVAGCDQLSTRYEPR